MQLKNKILEIFRSKNIESGYKTDLELKINRKYILTALLLIAVVLQVFFLTADYAINYASLIESQYIRRIFNITREDGLASWFAIIQTFLVALTAWAIYVLSKIHKANKRHYLPWLVIAIVFMFFSMDDGATIHERLGSALGEAQQGGGWLSAFPSYDWQIIYFPFLAVFGVWMLIFLLGRLNKSKEKILVMISFACLGAALVLDYFEGLPSGHSQNIYTGISENINIDGYTSRVFGQTSYDALAHFSKAIEESFEMLANSLLLVVFISHLFQLGPKISIKTSTNSK